MEPKTCVWQKINMFTKFVCRFYSRLLLKHSFLLIEDSLYSLPFVQKHSEFPIEVAIDRQLNTFHVMDSLTRGVWCIVDALGNLNIELPFNRDTSHIQFLSVFFRCIAHFANIGYLQLSFIIFSWRVIMSLHYILMIDLAGKHASGSLSLSRKKMIPW